jgi:hypothetical protein
MKLAEESKQQGWWQPYHLGYDTYVGLEAEAVIISAFQSSVVRPSADRGLCACGARGCYAPA